MSNDYQNNDVTRRCFLRSSSGIVAGAAVFGSAMESVAVENTAATTTPAFRA